MPKSYKINSNLVALMGQDSLSVFAFEELSQKIKKATNFNLISANDFYLIETSCPWEKINDKKKDSFLIFNQKLFTKWQIKKSKQFIE